MSSRDNSINPNKDDSEQSKSGASGWKRAKEFWKTGGTSEFPIGDTEGKVVSALTFGKYQKPDSTQTSEGTKILFVPPSAEDASSQASRSASAYESDPTRPGGSQYRPPSHAPSDLSEFDVKGYQDRMAAANSVYTRMHGVPESGEGPGDEVESDTEGGNPRERLDLGIKVTKRSSQAPSWSRPEGSSGGDGTSK